MDYYNFKAGDIISYDINKDNTVHRKYAVVLFSDTYPRWKNNGIPALVCGKIKVTKDNYYNVGKTIKYISGFRVKKIFLRKNKTVRLIKSGMIETKNILTFEDRMLLSMLSDFIVNDYKLKCYHEI